MNSRICTRRGFLLAGAAITTAVSGAALFGCSAKEDEKQEQSAAQEQESLATEEKPAPEPGSSFDNPISVNMGDQIRVDDAILTIDSCDGFCDELRGTDPTYNLKIDDGKLAFLVRCTLTYEGKSEILPLSRIYAQVLFDGGYKYRASVNDTEKIMSPIAPLETRGVTLCAEVAESSTEQLTGPILQLSVAKRFDSESESEEAVYYQCSLL